MMTLVHITGLSTATQCSRPGITAVIIPAPWLAYETLAAHRNVIETWKSRSTSAILRLSARNSMT